jgi:hypothetical protein
MLPVSMDCPFFIAPSVCLTFICTDTCPGCLITSRNRPTFQIQRAIQPYVKQPVFHYYYKLAIHLSLSRSPDYSYAVCVQSSMKSRFEEKTLYSFLHRIQCAIATHKSRISIKKKVLMEEICRHTTESTQHNPFNIKKNTLKLDKKLKFYIPFKYTKFLSLLNNLFSK